ncbi:MAG: hypothetical protein HYT08_02895 [Candidatus Levybacteria bacterium]|nr:hypothetical protein [Candidatus Levybacteria bacterium]
MQEKLRENNLNPHYADRGGHGARHDFWKNVRNEYGRVGELPKEIAWIIVRNMRRDPRSGR